MEVLWVGTLAQHRSGGGKTTNLGLLQDVPWADSAGFATTFRNYGAPSRVHLPGAYVRANQFKGPPHVPSKRTTNWTNIDRTSYPNWTNMDRASYGYSYGWILPATSGHAPKTRCSQKNETGTRGIWFTKLRGPHGDLPDHTPCLVAKSALANRTTFSGFIRKTH